MAAGNPGRAPGPAHGGGRGGGRGGNRGGGRGGPGRGGNRGPFAGGLYNPSQPLQGRALYRAAQGIANAQITGPMHELAAQIARQNQQTHAAQQQTFGYYMQLAKEAQDAVNQEKGISGDLSGQLQGVNQQAQQQLAQFGQQAQGGALGAMSQLGLGAGQQQALQSEAARQQGMAGLNAQTFQSAGANQGANYQGAAVSNLGTFALRGQERLGDIGRAGQLANFPLTTKQAGLAASRGALTATALGQLRSQERNYQIAQQGLGLKGQALKLTAAQDAARNALTARGQNITRANEVGRLATTIRGQNLSHQDRQAALALRSARGGRGGSSTGGGSKPMTAHEQAAIYNEFDYIAGKIQSAQRNGYTEQQIRQSLGSGYDARAKAKVTQYPGWMIQAVYELLGWGHITPSTARQMHSLGLRGGYFRGKAIGVGPAPPAKSGPIGGTRRGGTTPHQGRGI